MRFVSSLEDAVSVSKEDKQSPFIPNGEVLRYVDYIGISGKVYKVPILSDGSGGEYRWMADVLWADLPIETRMRFAMGGGGRLSRNDIGEIIYRFGSDDCKKMLEIKE